MLWQFLTSLACFASLSWFGFLLVPSPRANLLEPVEQEEMVIVRRAGSDPSIHLDMANAWFPFTQPAWLLLLSAACALLAVTMVLSVARPEPLWGPACKMGQGVRRRLLRMLAMYLLNVYVLRGDVCLKKDGRVGERRPHAAARW